MSFFKSLLSFAAPVIGYALGGPIGGALGGAAGGLVSGGGIEGALKGAVTGYAGGSALGALSSGSAGNPLLQLLNAGSTLYSAEAGKSAAKKASAQQVAALNRATAQQRASLAQAKANVQPYLNAGAASANSLSSLVNDPNAQANFIRNNPFYASLADDAKRKLFATQAATGKLGTGGTLDELQNRLLMLGSGLMGDEIKRRQGVAELGSNTATRFNEANQSGQNALTGLTAAIGGAQAGGTLAAQDSLTKALQSGINTAGTLYGMEKGIWQNQ